jgi:multidrug efflux system outer membrane protein
MTPDHPAPAPRKRLHSCCAERRAVLLLGLGLGGCGLVPEGLSSGLALPGRLRAEPAPEAPQWPDAAWWRGFRSAELDALMQAAIGANTDIRAAAARVRQADAQVRVAAQSLLPTGNLSLSAQRSQTPRLTSTNPATGTAFGGGSRFIQRESFAASLGASYEVDFWGRARNTVAAAQQTASASRFDAGTVALTTTAALANTYFAVLAAREQLAIQEQNLAVAGRVLNVIRQRVAVGTTTGLELAQQEALLAQLRATIPPLRQAVEQNRNALGTLTGQPPEAVPMPAQPLARLRVPPVSAGLPSEVLVRRPDVWFAEANLAAAQADVAAARAALFPTIQLTASGGVQSLVLENLLKPGSSLYTLAAGLVQPVFQYGQLRAVVEAQRGRAEELLEFYRRAILDALVDVENALVALRETTEGERLQAEATAAAERAYAISEARLQAGTIDLITLLTTQTTLFNARNQLVQARLARLQAAVGLFRALGGGWR